MYFVRFSHALLRKELFSRLGQAGVEAEWKDILGDALTETVQDDKRFVVRSRTGGAAGKIFQCVGVKLPNTNPRASAEPTCCALGSENVVPRLSAFSVTC